jgi:hypothetical protein
MRSLIGRIGVIAAAPALAIAATLVTAGPAHAADPPCVFAVANIDGTFGDEVKAVQVQEGGGDEMYMELDGADFPSSGVVSFTFNGQGRPASAFGNPQKTFPATGEVDFELWEADGILLPDDSIGHVDIQCALSPGGQSTQTVEFHDDRTRAIYQVEMRVSRPLT